MKYERLPISILAIFGIACATPNWIPSSPNQPWEPWGQTARPPKKNTSHSDTSISANLIHWYQRHLRRPNIKGEGGCRFTPSCSHYALAAFDRFGFLGGLLLTFDRLFVRERYAGHGDYMPVVSGRSAFYFDPPH